MKKFQHARVWWLGLVLCVVARPAAAITLQVDYTYDTTNFFGAGNPQGAVAGAQAKVALEAAANYFSSILTDSFSAIQTPAPLYSSISNGIITWNWKETFANPTTGATVTVNDAVLPANRYVIYAGGGNLSGSIVGNGAVGGGGRSNVITGSNQFTPSEINQANATTSAFFSAVDTRGQASGFSSWGGAISFDSTGRNWHFDNTTQPTAGQTDFYSAALHELLHALGFGETSDSSSTTPWESFVTGSQFLGNNSEVANNFQPVPLSSSVDIAHWAQGTNSIVYGTSIAQEAVMTPSINDGQRKRVTALDVAALKDIGWSVIVPPGVNGDYNGNGVVDAADYVLWRNRLGQNFTLPNDTTPGTVTQADYNVWRSNFGASAGSGSGALAEGGAVPEPASVALLVLGWAALVPCRSRRRTPRLTC